MHMGEKTHQCDMCKITIHSLTSSQKACAESYGWNATQMYCMWEAVYIFMGSKKTHVDTYSWEAI